MPTATNPETGETVFLNPAGEWVPAQTATNPDTGETVAFDGIEWQPIQTQPQAPERSFAETALGTLEAGASVASGVGAEVLAGLGIIGKTGTEVLKGNLDLFGEGAKSPESRAAGERILGSAQQIREATTFQPRTEAGKEQVNALGEFLQPVGEAFQKAESAIGDKVFKETGSPALSALSEAIPTLAADLFTFGATKGISKIAKSRSLKKQITKELDQAVPTTDQLFDASRAVYTEIDEAGVTVKPEAMKSLAENVNKVSDEFGGGEGLIPTSERVVKIFNRIADEGGEITLGQLDKLRRQAQIPAKSLDPTEKAFGNAMIDEIDSFLEDAGTGALNGPPGSVKDISTRYKVARNLWGRARKSQTLQNALVDARNASSGFENGIRIEFGKILRNKKRLKFFSPEEIAEMRKVKEGSPGANIARLIGKSGFTDGKSTNFLGGSIGASVGFQAGGPVGAVIVPTIGFVSKKFAERLTKGNANFANQVIRAGKDARKITEAYIRNTPKKQRSPEDLAQLLQRPDIVLTDIKPSTLAKEARQLVIQNRNQARGAIATGQAVRNESQN